MTVSFSWQYSPTESIRAVSIQKDYQVEGIFPDIKQHNEFITGIMMELTKTQNIIRKWSKFPLEDMTPNFMDLDEEFLEYPNDPGCYFYNRE